MNLELVYHPNELLETVCEEWDIENPPIEPVELKKKMFEAMAKNGGIGIAGPQLGLPYRVFALLNQSTNNINERQMIAINPEIIEEDPVEVGMYESCLSVPGLVLNVTRPHKIKASWTNEKGQRRTETLVGYTARIFQHELDHLNGVMFMDRVSPLELKKAQAELQHKAQQG